MFYLVFFTKSALTDGAGWKSSSGVILGVRNGRMTWSIPLSSFSALVTGETSLLLPILHISGRIMHGKHRIGKVLLVGWCNVTAICWKIYFLFMLSTLARSCGGCLSRHYYEIRSFAISLLCHSMCLRLADDMKMTRTLAPMHSGASRRSIARSLARRRAIRASRLNMRTPSQVGCL